MPRGRSAASDSVVPVNIWVTNRSTGRTFVQHLVNRGWYSGNPYIVGNWTLHSEVAQLPGTECNQPAGDDCFTWRLYAQRIGRKTPRLLDASTQPGSQLYAPEIGAQGAQAVWVTGSGPKNFVVHRWLAGANAPIAVARTSMAFTPTSGGTPTYGYATIGQPGARPRYRLLRLGASFQSLGSVVSASTPAVSDQSVVYFPGRSTGRLNIERLGGHRSRGVGPSISAPYYIEWASLRQVVEWDDSAFRLVNTLTGASVKIASSSANIVVPHVENGLLSTGQNWRGGRLSVIGAGRLAT